MNLPLAIALSGIVFTAVTAAHMASKFDHPEALVDVQADVNKYVMFIYSADQYAKTVASVSTATTVSWGTIVASGVVPPAGQMLSMPSTWKAVLIPGGTWVGCTELNERSMSAVAQLVPPNTSGTTTSPQFQPVALASTTPNFLVLGTASEATSLASYCQ